MVWGGAVSLPIIFFDFLTWKLCILVQFCLLKWKIYSFIRNHTMKKQNCNYFNSIASIYFKHLHFHQVMCNNLDDHNTFSQLNEWIRKHLKSVNCFHTESRTFESLTDHRVQIIVQTKKQKYLPDTNNWMDKQYKIIFSMHSVEIHCIYALKVYLFTIEYSFSVAKRNKINIVTV